MQKSRGNDSQGNPMKHPFILAICLALMSTAFAFVPSSAAQQASQQQDQSRNQQRNQYRDEHEDSQQDLEQKDVTTFRGTISQKYSIFYLEISTTHNTYKLDDSRKAKLYLGKTVRVTGTLDEEKNSIRVKEISGVGDDHSRGAP
jgi:hemolysin activation/secretion protein